MGEDGGEEEVDERGRNGREGLGAGATERDGAAAGAGPEARLRWKQVNLPHQPSIFVSGIISSQSTILKSAMNPVKL
eukprot:486090-Hanusia_phi.AAC.1